jgi:hypothetical protein
LTPVLKGVHPQAALGWSRAAGVYERGRAGYPDAAVEAILADRARRRGGRCSSSVPARAGSRERSSPAAPA